MPHSKPCIVLSVASAKDHELLISKNLNLPKYCSDILLQKHFRKDKCGLLTIILACLHSVLAIAACNE